MRSALSADQGLTWEVEPGERLGNGGSYSSPRALFLDDGSCRLYCVAQGHGIVSAVSVDGGYTFALEPGSRIVQESTYEALSILAPEVLRIADGGYRVAGWSLGRGEVFGDVRD